MEQETPNNLPYFGHIWGKPKAVFRATPQSTQSCHLHERADNNR